MAWTDPGETSLFGRLRRIFDAVFPLRRTGDAFRHAGQRFIEGWQGGGCYQGQGLDIYVESSHLSIKEHAVFKVATAQDEVRIFRLQGRKQWGQVGDSFGVGSFEDDLEVKLLGTCFRPFHDHFGEFRVLIGQGNFLGLGINLVNHFKGSLMILGRWTDGLDHVLKPLPLDLIVRTPMIHVEYLATFS